MFLIEGDDAMSTITVQEEDDDDMSEGSIDRPTEELPPEGSDDATNIAPPNEENEEDAHVSNSSANNDDDEGDIDKLPIPRGRSIAYHYIQQKKAVFLSLDLEHGGDHVGLLQLSIEAFRMVPHPTDATSYTEVVREESTFNQHINPGPDALWNGAIGANSHGYHQNHPSITGAQDLDTVWGQFITYVNTVVRDGEVAILTAYNGETCDLKWLWKLTQAPNAPYTMPHQIKYFLDPLKVIREYKCKLHPTKSKLECLELGTVWSYTKDPDKPSDQRRNLNGAHDSLVDAKAQTDIIIHKFFHTHIDKSKSIRLIEELFSARDQSEMKKKMEPLRNVHQPWKELKKDGEVFAWQPREEDSYTGSDGGPKCGPTQWIKDKAMNATSLACLFLAIFPMSLIIYIAKMTNKYANEDWVVETEVKDADGNVKKRKVYKDCTADTEGARHRTHKYKKKYDITPGFVLAFIAILIIQGAHFGESKRGRKMWRRAPHGISIPYVSNTMTRDAYEFMRRFIHFCDNTAKRYVSGEAGYDPLYKVSYVMGEIMKYMHQAWTAGRDITIDESMIKYKGRAVCWVQYMPKKPIKHGIKVFVCCCAQTAVMLAYEIYVGAETSDVDGSAVQVCNRLISNASLT